MSNVTTPTTTSAADQAVAGASSQTIQVDQAVMAMIYPTAGIWTADTDRALYLTLERLDLILREAWEKVRMTLDLEDLWTMAQLTPSLDHCDPLRTMEPALKIPEEIGVDSKGATKLLSKIRAWDETTRWAVLRTVANATANASKCYANGSPFGSVFSNPVLVAELQRALDAQASKQS